MSLPDPGAGTHPRLDRTDLWRRMSEAAGLVDAEGAVTETIFGRMTALAAEHDAVNLGQGAPGMPAPEFLVEAAAEAMRAGANQYPPGQGVPALLDAIVAQRLRDHGHVVTRENVLVTVGATEALTSAVLALTAPGDTVLTFEPHYDSYAAATAAAGAELATVGLVPTPEGTFRPDWEAFAEAMAQGPAAVILNSPHNPTGAMFDAEAIRRIHSAVVDADAWLITDEVYEYLTYAGEHTSPAAVLEDASRVVTVSSAGKSFNATGWKVGWVIAEPEVRVAIQAVKQFLSFSAGTPFQLAVAAALEDHVEWAVGNRDALARNREVLVPALRSIPGAEVHVPEAGYFTIVDLDRARPALVAELAGHGIEVPPEADAFALNEALTRAHGFTGIPVLALCRPDSPASRRYAAAIRYSFCQSPEVVARAAEAVSRCARAMAATQADADGR